MTNRMTGKVVIITGGARGQGAAHARVLAGEGATVIITDVLDEVGEATAAGLSSAGGRAEYRHLDVSDEAAWADVVAAVVTDHGRIDGLVNNAGIVRIALPEEETIAAFLKVLTINAGGAFLGIKTVAEAMSSTGGGSIVNIASTNAHRGTPNYFSYNASKAAVVSMTKSAAISYADSSIRVNSVSPGWLAAPMLEEKTDPRAENDWRFAPVIVPKTLVREGGSPRGAAPEEISAAVLFLLSDESSFVNGTDILVDGGALAW